jgi:hypothetical protein
MSVHDGTDGGYGYVQRPMTPGAVLSTLDAMAIRTIVAIFLPGAPNGGALPNLVGTGSLIRKDAVLVHPPLSLELSLGVDKGPLRVCISSWAGAKPKVEIRKVAGIQVADAETVAKAAAAEGVARVQPIVGLALEAASKAQVDPPLSSVAEFLAHLADPSNGPETPDDDGDDNNVLCKIFGIFCH